MKTINNSYAYGADAHQFILYRSRIIKTSKDEGKVGTKAWDAVGYFPTINQLVNRLINLTSYDECENLVRLNTKINDIKRWVDKELFKTPNELI